MACDRGVIELNKVLIPRPKKEREWKGQEAADRNDTTREKKGNRKLTTQ
jgi:hypothetical protein